MNPAGKSKVLTVAGAVEALTVTVYVAALFYAGPASGVVEFRQGDGTGPIFASLTVGPSSVPVVVSFTPDRWTRNTGLHANFVGVGAHMLTVWYD